MGQSFFERSSAARAVFDQADEQLGFALSKLCFEGPEEALTDTVNQQPALFVTSIAAWQAAQAIGQPAPDFVAGHSLGEISALVAAGSLTLADGLRLVQRRGELMKAAGERAPGAMAAVLRLDVAAVEAACAEASAQVGRPVQLANDNCPGQVVISGDSAALKAAIPLLEARGAYRIMPLPISIAAHSALMASAADAFAAAVDATPIQTPQTPIIGNVSAAPLADPEAIRVELRRQLTSPVRWTASMAYLLAAGVDTFIEVGAGAVLTGLMKRIDRNTTREVFSLPDPVGEVGEGA